MRLTTTATTTVADVLAALEGQDPTETVTFGRARKADQKNACWCGCGGTTGGRFVPGHDSKLHSLAKQVARGTADREEALAGLPHDEATAHFLEHVAAEEPRHAAREAAKQAKADQREADKQAKADAKADATEADEPADQDEAALPHDSPEFTDLLASVTQAV